MRSMASGFTLIELMIVVAIIAILGAIALPAYQDYVIRTQVSEGLVLMEGSKSAIVEFYSNTGRLPTVAASAGLASAVSITGTYVSQVQIGNAAGGPGLIRATFSSGGAQKAHPAINGKLLVLVPTVQAGSIEWTCNTPGNTVTTKYLPTACRP